MRTDKDTGVILLDGSDVISEEPLNENFKLLKNNIKKAIANGNLVARTKAEVNGAQKDIGDLKTKQDTQDKSLSEVHRHQRYLAEFVDSVDDKASGALDTIKKVKTEQGTQDSKIKNIEQDITRCSKELKGMGTQVTINKNTSTNNTSKISTLQNVIKDVNKGTVPISSGGTGATTAQRALENLGITISRADPPAKGKPYSIYIKVL